MSKARTRALEAIATALKTDAAEALAEAICALIEDGLGSLERIALALEKPSIAAMGEGLVVGDIAKFEPAFDPALVERAVAALEAIAANVPEYETVGTTKEALERRIAEVAKESVQRGIDQNNKRVL